MKKIPVLLLGLVCFCFAAMSKSVSFSNSLIYTSGPIKAEDSNTYVEINYGNFNKIIEAGVPELPVIYKQYIMSVNEEPTGISIVKKSTYEYKLDYPLLPSEGMKPISGEFEYRGFVGPRSSVYSTNKLYPENPIEILHDGWMGGNHIVKIAIYPIQFNPVNNSYVFNEHIEFEIQTKAGNIKQEEPQYRSNMMQKIRDRSLAKIIDNPEDIQKYGKRPSTNFRKTSVNSTISFYDYVIITESDLVSYFDDFVEWKTRKGINIGVVTIESIYANYSGDLISGIYDNAGKLRQYLSDAYYNGTTFSLLAGDENVLPYREGWGYGPNWLGNWEDIPILADLYFSDFTADWNYNSNALYGETKIIQELDIYPEIYVGRILINSGSEIENWIRKVLIYEQDPGRGYPDYVKSTYFSQADQMQANNWAGTIKNYLDVLGFTTTIVEEESSYDDLTPTAPTAPSIISDLQVGYGIASLMGHGSPHQISVRTPGINVGGWWDQITTFENMADGSGQPGGAFECLENFNYPGIHYSISCSNCEFITDMCGGARNFPEMYMNKEAGGIAYLGNTRHGWIPSSLYLFEEFVDLLNDSGTESIGVLEGLSKTATNNRYLWLSHNAFACPETKIWTDIPDEFANVSITDNTSYITVNAGESGCNICVSAEDPDDYLLSVSDVQSYSFTTSERPVYVVITKDNKLPYISLVGMDNITGTVTLSNNFSYTIRNDITVSSTGVLNIEAGTTLKFCEDKELMVHGDLCINGTKESPVIFTSDDPNAGRGYWDGVKAYNGGGINANNLHVFNANAAVAGEYATITLDSCLIKDNFYGFMVSNCTGNNSCTIENSTIISNTSYSVRYYNCNGTISGNSISDSFRGIYARGNVDISHNQLSDLIYDGIWCLSYDGDIYNNEISDCRDGVYFTSSSSGDMVTWASLNELPDVNNVFSTPMRYCVNIGSGTTPNLGIIFELDEGIEAGWNVFCDPTNYDVKSLSSSYIQANGNWWGNTISISGNVYYTFTADEMIALFFPKRNVLSDEEIQFKEAYELERNKQLFNAAQKYLTLIERNIGKEDITYLQKSMHRMRGCYRKLNAYSDLETVLIDLSNKYPRTYVSALAKKMNASLLSIKKDYTGALNILENSANIFVDLDMKEAAAYSLLDKYELLEYLSEREGVFNKSSLSLELTNCKERLLDEFEGTEASKIMKELLGNSNNNEIVMPLNYFLGSPYPNPFNPILNVPYDLPKETHVRINIYDVTGKKVQTLVNRTHFAGSYSISFNASNLSSGLYFVKLESSDYTAVKKVMLLK
jgi:hypothetical protein